MAYSGTVAQTTFNTARVIDTAVRRCRLMPQQITAETLETAKDALYLLLSDQANLKLPLWCVEQTLYPFYEGDPKVTLTPGTVDILNCNVRQLQRVTGTETVETLPPRITTEFTSATQVTTVGILWSAASATGIALERSNDGVTWKTIQTEAPSAGVEEWSWFDVDVAVAALYFRVRAVTGALDVTEVYLGNTPSEIPCSRMSRDIYTSFPNKSSPGLKPLQYWLDRKASSPVMRLWPVPEAGTTYMQMVVWAHRQIMDVGSFTDDLEVPQRWLEAIVSMLAAKLAASLPDVDPALVPALETKAQQALYNAQAEERDNSPMTIAPDISMYTR